MNSAYPFFKELAQKGNNSLELSFTFYALLFVAFAFPLSGETHIALTLLYSRVLWSWYIGTVSSGRIAFVRPRKTPE